MDASISNTDSYYILKIFSGPHQGAEVLLQTGTITIGSDLECDIVLSDALIAPKHIQLIVSETGGLTFLPLHEPVYLEGKYLKLEQQSLQPYQYLTLGTTYLAVGLHGKPWPQVILPALEAPIAEEESSVDNVDTTSGDSQKTNTVPSAPASKPLSKKQKIAERKKNRGRLLLLLFMLLMVGGVWLLTKMQAFEEPQRITKSINLDTIQDQLSIVLPKLEYVQELSINRSGPVIEVTGYVNTYEEKQNITNIISTISRAVRSNIYCQEEIVRNCSEMLSSFDFNLNVESYAPGCVLISGYFADRMQWFSGKQHLLKDIIGLKTIKDQVITEKEVHSEISNVLLEYGLNDRITIEAAESGVMATGDLISSMTPMWEEAKKLIMERLGQTIPFFDKVKVPNTAGLEKIFFDSKIESVTIDDKLSWIKLQNGSTYFQGSGLPSGYVLDTIQKDSVILRRGKDTVTFRIGEK